MLTGSPQLEYARGRPRWHRRRGPRRALFGGVLAFAIAGVCCGCIHSSTPLQRFEAVPLSPRRARPSPVGERLAFAATPPWWPAEWRSPVVPADCPKWSLLKPYLGLQHDSGTMVFLDDLQTPGGQHRLVVVEAEIHVDIFSTDSDPEPIVVEVSITAIKPSRDRQPPSTTEKNLFIDIGPTGRLELFAGRRDASDPSHFTIAYRLNDGLGTLDLNLRDDDKGDMKIRTGPLLPTSILQY
jgi:hypothetical protein